MLLPAAEALLRSFSGTKLAAVPSFVAGRAARTLSPRRTFATTSASASPSAVADPAMAQQAPVEKFRKVLIMSAASCTPGVLDWLTDREALPSSLPAPARTHSHPASAASAASAASQDYTPTPYLVDSVHLNFLLNEDVTRVESRLRLHPNAVSSSAAAGGTPPPLCLDGREGERGRRASARE